jgi:hypothetical protein
MSRELKTLKSVARAARAIELVGPKVDFKQYNIMVDHFVDTVNRYVGGEPTAPFVDRVNYISHIVRASGRLHDSSAPKVLDLNSEIGADFVARFGDTD